ncbi:MAG: four helix bundle protein [Candidatus Aminicenantia bacterium]
MKHENKKEDYQNITDRAFDFGVRVVKLVTSLPRNLVTTEIGRQLIRSGTAIHSILVHADSASSKKEFIFYNNKACTEARESEKWIKMLIACDLLKESQTLGLLKENNEIISILVSISKSAQKNIQK